MTFGVRRGGTLARAPNEPILKEMVKTYLLQTRIVLVLVRIELLPNQQEQKYFLILIQSTIQICNLSILIQKENCSCIEIKMVFQVRLC